MSCQHFFDTLHVYMLVLITFSLTTRMGMKWSLAIMPYGEEWRKVRRRFHQYFNTNVVSSYIPIHEAQSRDFLKRLHQTPVDFLAHIRQYVQCRILVPDRVWVVPGPGRSGTYS